MLYVTSLALTYNWKSIPLYCLHLMPFSLHPCPVTINLISSITLLFLKHNWPKTVGLVQFSSVAQSCLTLCNPMNCSMPGLPVHSQLPRLTQAHIHRVGDAIQPSHPLSSPSPLAFNLSQHQGLFQWVSFFHQVAKVLELQLQHLSFQWIFRTDLF